MSRTSPQERRLRFFKRGNTHCPICWTPFTERDVRAGEVVTLEHAPQESVGGKPACLTCEPCNTGPSTGMIDQAVARYYQAQDDGGYPITVEGGSGPYTIHPKYFDIGKDEIRIRTRRDLFGENLGSFTLHWTEPKPDAILLGLLKSAYLMVFSLLGEAGYRYAQGEAVSSIREQLLSPEKELIRPLVGFTDTANTEHAVLLLTEYQCWAVKIRSDLVILPPGGSIDRYQRLAGALEPPLTLGSTVQWTAPKFGGHSPVYGKKSDALKTKHLFGASFPNPRQDYVVVYDDSDMAAMLPVSRPAGKPSPEDLAGAALPQVGRLMRPDEMASRVEGESRLRGTSPKRRRGPRTPAIQTRFSRFYSTIQQGPVQRQETQIVQSCITLDDFLPGFGPPVLCWSDIDFEGGTILWRRRARQIGLRAHHARHR